MRRGRFIIPLLVMLALGFVIFHWSQREFFAPGPLDTPIRIEVKPGMSVRKVLAMLEERGAIKDQQAAETHLRLHGRRLNIKAGTYEIAPHARVAEIIRQLEKGAVVLEQLTVVEGSTFAQLRHALEGHPAIVPTLRGKSDAEVMIAIGHGGEPPEGKFFPDTYRFAARTPDVEVLKLAYNKMQQLIDEAWKKRRTGLPLRTPNEALILASIVEKETGLASERARIAGVFIGRLRKGMRLQSDPTVIYGIGEKYDGDIRTRDLSTDTPYNTYTRPGLPPTPIALPGRDSVIATVQPDETGALYFVATGDGTGAHYFSKTLEEHNEAVKRYLARLRRQASGGS